MNDQCPRANDQLMIKVPIPGGSLSMLLDPLFWRFRPAAGSLEIRSFHH